MFYDWIELNWIIISVCERASFELLNSNVSHICITCWEFIITVTTRQFTNIEHNVHVLWFLLQVVFRHFKVQSTLLIYVLFEKSQYGLAILMSEQKRYHQKTVEHGKLGCLIINLIHSILAKSHWTDIHRELVFFLEMIQLCVIVNPLLYRLPPSLWYIFV